MPIKVSLNIDGDPAVTVDPESHNVDQGNQTIDWKPADQQDFVFYSLVIPYPPPTPPTPPATSPFGPFALSTDKLELSVTDSNTGAANGVTYEYLLTVTYNGNGLNYDTKKRGPGGNTGNPSIKNN